MIRSREQAVLRHLQIKQMVHIAQDHGVSIQEQYTIELDEVEHLRGKT